MDYVDNVSNDKELHALIESSSELQERLKPFKNTLPLISQLRIGVLDDDIPEELKIENIIKTVDIKGSSYIKESHLEDSDLEEVQISSLKQGILNQPVPNAMRSILDNELKKNKNEVAQSWPEKLRINLASILSIEQSPAFVAMAASVLLAVGLYVNIQNPTPEWQDRLASMGHDYDKIDSSEWFSSSDIENYTMPSSLMEFRDLTLGVSSSNSENAGSQNNNEDTSNMVEVDEYLQLIDPNLTASYVSGVLHDLSSKETPQAQIFQNGKEFINIQLYGKNTAEENCILGEISTSDDNLITYSRFFNFCSYDFEKPLQFID